jgi:tetratricopeptide (TPR) repeat protein
MTDWELGVQAFRQGRLREAADRLQAAVEDSDRTVMREARFQTLAHLGAALYALGRAADAADAFKAAIGFALPSGPPTELLVNWANASLAAGRPEEARRALEQVLRDAPGHLEAQVLLDRLGRRDPDAPLSGETLGDSPAGVVRYIQTLSFKTVPAYGLDPAQVRLALTQIERHIEFLVLQIVSRDETIAGLEAENQYLHSRDIPAEVPSDGTPLTPLEALLRQTPKHSS